MAKQIEDFHAGCRMIVANQDAKALNWCVNYAKKGLTMMDADSDYTHTQALYILDNMKSWRGDTAKKARTLIKKFIKG